MTQAKTKLTDVKDNIKQKLPDRENFKILKKNNSTFASGVGNHNNNYNLNDLESDDITASDNAYV